MTGWTKFDTNERLQLDGECKGNHYLLNGIWNGVITWFIQKHTGT